jgi:hypothetical protein
MMKRTHKRSDLVEEECIKIPYATPQEAYRVVAGAKGRRRRKASSVYYCSICKAHHVTSKGGKR